MVLTTTMVFAQTDGIESVLLNHTCTRGPSVTRMRDFFKKNLTFYEPNLTEEFFGFSPAGPKTKADPPDSQH